MRQIGWRQYIYGIFILAGDVLWDTAGCTYGTATGTGQQLASRQDPSAII